MFSVGEKLLGPAEEYLTRYLESLHRPVATAEFTWH